MSRQRNWAALLVSDVALLLGATVLMGAGWCLAAGIDAALRLVAGVLS